MGKGDKRRPRTVSQEEYDARWEAIFSTVKDCKEMGFSDEQTEAMVEDKFDVQITTEDYEDAK